MFGLVTFITVLFIAAGWYLITLAARDIFVTARLAAGVRPKDGKQSIYYYSLSCLIMGRAYRIIRCRKRL